MCFSASASFAAGAVLTVIGVATIKKTQHPSHLLFACIPLIFGVQQISEGILWRTLPNPEYVNTQKVFTYVYLFFAQVFWPIWVPIAILFLDKSASRKNLQKVFIGAGILASFYFAYCIITSNVDAKIEGHHIIYLLVYPAQLQYFVFILYALATIVPSFFSHIKHMWLFGTTILVSYLITLIFYNNSTISVWCFFSAIISLSIYIIIKNISIEQNKKQIET